jgi:hypothetical protein
MVKALAAHSVMSEDADVRAASLEPRIELAALLAFELVGRAVRGSRLAAQA